MHTGCVNAFRFSIDFKRLNFVFNFLFSFGLIFLSLFYISNSNFCSNFFFNFIFMTKMFYFLSVSPNYISAMYNKNGKVKKDRRWNYHMHFIFNLSMNYTYELLYYIYTNQFIITLHIIYINYILIT